MKEVTGPQVERDQPASGVENSAEIIGISLSQDKERTPEERKQLRETIGAEAAKKYLDAQPDDDGETRKLKAEIAGKDLEGAIGQLLEAGTEAERRAIMEQ